MPQISPSDLPPNLRNLISDREAARQAGNFALADAIRQKLLNAGYEAQDSPQGLIIYQSQPVIIEPTLTLFGSGEISSVGRLVHETVLNKLHRQKVKIVLITTPAGFQPNVELVYGEIRDFFNQSLANFHPEVTIVFANNRDAANDPKVIEPLFTADYIFTGPGSPTYAVNHLKDTLLLSSIINRVKGGEASLALASATTIAFSKFCLPVYEIYKVGEALHWQNGLNVFQDLVAPLTIIPHFNNTEGGVKTDTSYCYMGKVRFAQLRSLLAPMEALWGLDEHTAVVIDLKTGERQTIGKGQLHYLTP